VSAPDEQPRVCHRCGRVPDSASDERCPDDGLWYVDRRTHERYSRDPLLGVQLADKYALVEVLGEGGFGIVYRGRQLAEGRVLRDVAVKVVRPGGDLQSDESVGRFRREAEAIARLNHPNIVQLYDFGVEDGNTFYMVLELVDGRTLAQVFADEEPFTPDRVLVVFRQVLQALSAAHSAGMVHRDLKPENIMLLETAWEPDYVKILDFGLAKVFGSDDSLKLSRTNVAYGTVHYMSPEQVVGSKVDQRTDLYPIGVMTYRIYSGVRPFDAETAPIVMFQHVHNDVPELPDGVPASMRTFIYRALQKRPKDRFRDAKTMLEDLETALADPTYEVEGGKRPVGIPRPKSASGAEDIAAALGGSVARPVTANSQPLIVMGNTPATMKRMGTRPPAAPRPAAADGSEPDPGRASEASDSLAHASAEIVETGLDDPPPDRRRPLLAAIAVGLVLGLVIVGAVLALRQPEPTAGGPTTTATDTSPQPGPPPEPAPIPAPMPAVAPDAGGGTGDSGADAARVPAAANADAGGPTKVEAEDEPPKAAPKKKKKKRRKKKRKKKRKSKEPEVPRVD